jgi:hypothetical protein
VPAQQRLGPDQPGIDAPPTSGEAGEQSPISRLDLGSLDLAAEYGDFVAQDDDLDGQFVAVAPEKPDELNNPTEGQIAERESHTSSPLAKPP